MRFVTFFVFTVIGRVAFAAATEVSLECMPSEKPQKIFLEKKKKVESDSQDLVQHEATLVAFKVDGKTVGFQIIHLTPDFEQMGIKEGDVWLGVNGKPLDSNQSLVKLDHEMSGKASFCIAYRSGDQVFRKRFVRVDKKNP
jgi:hypothetical protein